MDYKKLDELIDTYDHPEEIDDNLISEIIEEGRVEYREAWNEYIEEF